MNLKTRSTSTSLFLAALLLLGVLAVRAHAISAMPVFNDESLHIRRSEVVWTFDNPATSFTAGKLFGYYWLGFFGFDRLDALHMGRLVYALFVLIGAAATYRVGRELFNAAVGLLALLLYGLAPYLIFYERLILADQLAAAFGMLAVWMSIRVARHPTRANGLRCGLFVSLAILAKLTAAPFALVPLVAVIILGSGTKKSPTLQSFIPARYWPALIASYGFNLISGVPFMLFPLFRQVKKEPVLLVGENLVSLGNNHRVFVDNLGNLWHMLAGFFGAGAVIAALLVILWLFTRERSQPLYLAACVILPWSMILILSPDPSNRYWLLGMPPLLVLVAAGLYRLPFRWPVLAVSLAVWIAMIGGPFIRDAWNDPLKLHLPRHDRWEYYTNYSSGYGLSEAAHYLPSLPPSTTSGRIPVISTTVGCHALRVYLPEDGLVNLSCPFFGWQGEFMETVNQTIAEALAAESVVYLLVEPEAPFAQLDQIPYPCELIRRFDRPFDGVPVELCRVAKN